VQAPLEFTTASRFSARPGRGREAASASRGRSCGEAACGERCAPLEFTTKSRFSAQRDLVVAEKQLRAVAAEAVEKQLVEKDVRTRASHRRKSSQSSERRQSAEPIDVARRRRSAARVERARVSPSASRASATAANLPTHEPTVMAEDERLPEPPIDGTVQRVTPDPLVSPAPAALVFSAQDAPFHRTSAAPVPPVVALAPAPHPVAAPAPAPLPPLIADRVASADRLPRVLQRATSSVADAMRSAADRSPRVLQRAGSSVADAMLSAFVAGGHAVDPRFASGLLDDELLDEE